MRGSMFGWRAGHEPDWSEKDARGIQSMGGEQMERERIEVRSLSGLGYAAGFDEGGKFDAEKLEAGKLGCPGEL